MIELSFAEKDLWEVVKPQSGQVHNNKTKILSSKIIIS